MTTAVRTTLPQRRFSETTEMRLPGKQDVFAVTIGRYHDGKIGEVFVSGAKAGSEVDAVARDGAVLLSIALQYGLPLDAFRAALTRNLDGTPSSIIGAVVDRLCGK
jgi:hypothetical protein